MLHLLPLPENSCCLSRPVDSLTALWRFLPFRCRRHLASSRRLVARVRPQTTFTDTIAIRHNSFLNKGWRNVGSGIGRSFEKHFRHQTVVRALVTQPFYVIISREYIKLW